MVTRCGFSRVIYFVLLLSCYHAGPSEGPGTVLAPPCQTGKDTVVTGARDTDRATVEQAATCLLGHHSGDQLARTALRSITMANAGSWKCMQCKQMVKMTANYCPSCGQHWKTAAAPEFQPYGRPAAPKSPRRPPSPRQRPWHPKGGAPSKPKGPTKGTTKGQVPEGLALPSDWMAPPIPWQATTASTAADDSSLQGLLQAVHGYFPGQSLPQPIAEAVAKLEADTGRRLTKNLHSQTAQLGAAKRRLQEVKAAKAKHEHQWVEFLNGTIQALEKGAKQYQETVDTYLSQEEDAKTKLAAARQAIRDLTTAPHQEEDGTMSVQEESDLELLVDAGTSGAQEAAEPKVVQAQKKLRVTLDTLMARLPMTEADTPRRRGREKDQTTNTREPVQEAPPPGEAAAPEVDVCGSEWPGYSFWHSVMEEEDFLSAAEAIGVASLWDFCCSIQSTAPELACLASMQGGRAFRERWFGQDECEELEHDPGPLVSEGGVLKPPLCMVDRQGSALDTIPPETEDLERAETHPPFSSAPKGILKRHGDAQGRQCCIVRFEAFCETWSYEIDHSCEDLYRSEESNCTGFSARRASDRPFGRCPPGNDVSHDSPALTLSQLVRPESHTATALFSTEPLQVQVPTCSDRQGFHAAPGAGAGLAPTHGHPCCRQVGTLSEPTADLHTTETPGGKVESPSGLSARPRKPTMLSQVIAEQVEMRPDTITGPLPYQPISTIPALCSVPADPVGVGRYVVMDPRRHVFLRPSDHQWAPIDYLADAIAAVHYVPRVGVFLRRPLADLPSPQIVLTPPWEPPGHFCLPVDLRPWHEQVCVICVRAGMDAVQLRALLVTQGCWPDSLLDVPHCRFRDASGDIVARIHDPVEAHDWLLVEHEQPEEEPGTVDQALALFQQPGLTLAREPHSAQEGPLSQPGGKVGTLSEPTALAPETCPASPPCSRKVGTLSVPTAALTRAREDRSSRMPATLRFVPQPLVAPQPSTPNSARDLLETDARKGQLARTTGATQALGQPVAHPPEVGDPPLTPGLALRDAVHPSDAQKLAIEHVQIVPSAFRDWRYFDRIVTSFRWGTSSPNTYGTYTVFDGARHMAVEKCHTGADLESIVALAVARAPFPVSSLMVLTDPIGGLPKPQLVLAGQPQQPGDLPIPWDLRSLGFNIRTIIHRPDQPTSDALRSLQNTLPPGTDLDGLWRTAHIHLADALGPLPARLPQDLTDSQHFRAFRILGGDFRLNVMHSPLFLGGTGATETTATTTAAYARGEPGAQPCIRLIIFRGEVSASIDVQPPYHTFDEALARLLHHHAAASAFGASSTIVLARALPPALGYVQEVVLLISDDSDTTPFVWDARNVGGALSAQHADPYTVLEFVTSQEWRDRQWMSTVNGVPVHLASRCVSHGDFLQPFQEGQRPPSTPQGVVLDLIPALGMFSWPFRLSHFRRMYLPRLRDRRWRIGLNFYATQHHWIIGPQHGDLRLCVPEGRPLDHAEIISYLNRLDNTPSWDHIAASSAGDAGNPVFVTAARNSGLSTILSPAPGFPGRWLVLLLPSSTRQARGVPATTVSIFHPDPNFRHGGVLVQGPFSIPPVPDSSDIEDMEDTQPLPRDPEDTTSEAVRRSQPHPSDDPDLPGDEPLEDAVGLLQRHARRVSPARDPTDCNGPRPVIPTPFGRRRLPSICKTAPAIEGGFKPSLPATVGTDGHPSTSAGPDTCAHNPTGTETTSLTVEGGSLSNLPVSTGPDAVSPPHLTQPVELTLDSLLPLPGPCIGWAVDHDIAQQCLCSHHLESLHSDLSPLETDLRAAAKAWRTLPPWDPQVRCDEAFLFTDGSYYGPHATASWALVVVVRQGACVCRAGFHAATVHLATVGKESAFQGELEGLLHATAFACTIGAGIVHIASDCQSALDLISSAGGAHQAHPATRALLGFLNFAHCSGILVLLHKVEAHSGCGLNDLADALAKQAGRAGCGNPWPWEISVFSEAVQECVPERLWLLCATAATCLGLPPVHSNGTWTDSCQRTGVRPPPSLPIGFVQDPQQPKQCRLPLRLLTYNVLSLKGVAAHELMAKGLRANGVSVAGFQETREKRSGFSHSQGWWVLSASSDEAGAGGAQVWINPQQPGLSWDRQALSILCATPQCLIVLARVNGLDLAITVAHAPTAVSSPESLAEWWESLHSQVRRIPPRFVLITCIDANARFVQDPAYPDTLEATPKTRNCEHLREFAQAIGADISQQFSNTGAPLTSWRSPNGNQALLDYILFPRAWRPAAATLDTPCLNDLHCDVDHFPVLLCLDVTCDTSIRPAAPRVNIDALRTPQGQSLVRAAFASMPAIPWSLDTTSHLDTVHRHLHACLQALPPAPPKPRNPALSADTIALVVRKRHARRCLRVVRARTLRLCTDILTQVCNRPATVRDLRQLEAQIRLEKRHAAGCRELRDALTKAILQDRACFARKAIADARDQGPREFSHKLRAVLRTGRKFRSPPLLPVIHSSSGECAGREDVLDEFARFFATPERARPVSIRCLLDRAAEADPAPVPLDGESLPSVVQLAAAFGQLKPNKAPGISQLPSEVFRADPMASARAVWPILAKATVRDGFPFQWKGGAAAAVPKPGKDGSTLGGFRSVLLLEPTAKAAQVSLRPLLHSTFLGIKTATHYGGVAGAPISLPALCARAHLQFLHHSRGSGGAIFVDCRAAYYSIAREVLHASPQELQSDTWVRARARIFFKDPGQQDDFIAALRAHAVPDLLHRQPVLATLLRKQLDGTWFSGRADSPNVMQAESGTVPGSPIADLLFGLAFQHFLHSIEDILAEQGCQAFAAFCNSEPTDNEVSSAPTWADDVCILFQTSRPEGVPQAVATIMRGVTHGMHIQGLEANLGEGKTEAMIVVHGQGSQNVRRDMLCTSHPTVTFPGPNGDQCVRLVPEYTHLGCVLRADGSDFPGLVHRERQAMLLYRPVRRRLLSNPYLTEAEKCGLLTTRILPCFLHGAGMLVLSTSRERVKFEDTVYRMYRGAFRPILGVSCKGFTNLEVVSALGMQTPDELLLTHRARTLAEVARAGLWRVLSCLQASSPWWAQATDAAITVGLLDRRPEDVAELQRMIRTDRGVVSRLCCKFLKEGRKGRSFDRSLLVHRMRRPQSLLVGQDCLGPAPSAATHMLPTASLQSIWRGGTNAAALRCRVPSAPAASAAPESFGHFGD
ncbi:CACNA1S [Symbiodinium sp. CCMP2592]|nr:CACNA1S [Symbiodinium sp. CCMP2592]